MDSPLRDADEPELVMRMLARSLVASRLKVLSTYFYRYTLCVMGSNENVSGRHRRRRSETLLTIGCGGQ